jgi:hypothetical protein
MATQAEEQNNTAASWSEGSVRGLNSQEWQQKPDGIPTPPDFALTVTLPPELQAQLAHIEHALQRIEGMLRTGYVRASVTSDPA